MWLVGRVGKGRGPGNEEKMWERGRSLERNCRKTRRSWSVTGELELLDVCRKTKLDYLFTKRSY